MRNAFVRNNVAHDVIGVDPHTVFGKEYADKFESVPDQVESGWVRVSGVWQERVIDLARDLPRAKQALKLKRQQVACGGVQVGAALRWIASDATARARWAAMDALGAALPVDQEEETLDDVIFTVQPAFANKVPIAYAALDKAVHLAYRVHRLALEASADPLSYNINTGWPTTFTG